MGDITEIFNILNTPLPLRKAEMTEVLCDLTRNISFFTGLIKDLGEKMFFLTCELLTAEFFLAGSAVINEGDPGSKFFIILEGKVKVLIDQTKNGVTEKLEIGVLEKGRSFGELALLKNQPRRATIVCLENCYFMTLSKENYLKILGKSFLQKLDERINFLHGLKIFSKWSKKSLEKLTYFFEQRVVRNNEFIYKQGEEADRVYFIQSGEIELTVASTITKSSYFPKSLKIAVISENDIFGDDEVIKGITRKFSTRCITNTANLLWISKQYFLMRVNKDSLRSLKSTNLIRSNFREKRMKTIEIEKKSESGSTLIKPQVFIRTLCKTTNKLLKDLKFRNTSVRVSGKFIDSIKKKSLLDVSSPTALIIDEVIKDSPKTIRFFYNTKGFQPSNKNPSGAFQSIQKNFKDRTTFGPSFS